MCLKSNNKCLKLEGYGINFSCSDSSCLLCEKRRVEIGDLAVVETAMSFLPTIIQSLSFLQRDRILIDQHLKLFLDAKGLPNRERLIDEYLMGISKNTVFTKEEIASLYDRFKQII